MTLLSLLTGLHTLAGTSQVEITEKRFPLKNGAFSPVSETVITNGILWECLPVLCNLFRKRLDEGFTFSDCETPESCLYRIGGTSENGTTFLSVSFPEENCPEGLEWLRQASEYQADPFAGFPSAMEIDENGTHLSQTDRDSRIAEAVVTGDNRQRAKRGIPAASGKAYSPTVKIVNLQENPEPRPEVIPTEEIPTKAVMDGTYTVVFADSYRTLKIYTQDDNESFMPGKQLVSYLSGSDNESSYTSFGILNPDGRIVCWKKFRETETETSIKQAVSVLLNDPKTAGLAYALASGKCYRCNRKLTVPTSIHNGLGPECAKKAL